jgi:hypothetical protein
MAIKKNNNTDLFDYLDWIVKKKGKEPPIETVPYAFIVNRWLSMLDIPTCQVVNNTCNRWISVKSFYSESYRIGRFFKTCLPKTSKCFKYIKKAQKEEKEDQDSANFANTMEISLREVYLYEKTLAEITEVAK